MTQPKIFINSGGTAGPTAGYTAMGGAYVFWPNPFTNTGTIISASSTYAWVFDNEGVIDSPSTSYAALGLGDGSVVTNGASATIIGQKEGVEIFGAGTVANSGIILGSNTNTGIGVDFLNGGTVANYAGATINGAEGIYIRAAAGTVSNSGTIGSLGSSGHSYGIHLQEGGEVTNAASAEISGYAAGVFSDLAAATVTNFGTIEQTGTAGNTVADVGIRLGGGGVVTNGTDASVTGFNAAVLIQGGNGSVGNSGYIAGRAGFGVKLFGGFGRSGTVTNYGTILGTTGTVANAFGYQAGVAIYASLGTVVNIGTIEATGTGSVGVIISGGGTVANGQYPLYSGQIVGEYGGVSIGYAAGFITNAGDIIGTGGFGVKLFSGGIVTNDSGGVINGGTYGIVSLSAATVTNFGAIGGYVYRPKYGIFLQHGGTVTNGGTAAGNASIIGSTGGVLIFYPGVVVNDGSIYGATGFGVELGFGGSVTNKKYGTINGGIYGIHVVGTAGTVVNYGTVADAVGDGIYLAAGGYTKNATGGSISGAVNGVRVAGAYGKVLSYGTIAGTAGDGIYLKAGGYLKNFSGGSVTGGVDGVQVGGAAAGATGGVVNYGTIAGTAAIGVSMNVLAGGVLHNYGTGGLITGGIDGVVIAGAYGNIVNRGMITAVTGAVGTGIYLKAGGQLRNGVMGSPGGRVAGSGEGIQINGGGVGITGGNVFNYGAIAGVAGVGVELDTGGYVKNDQAGSITGGVYGILVKVGYAKIDNSGTIAQQGSFGSYRGSTGVSAIALNAGGSVNNSQYGYIGGASGIVIAGGVGKVANLGTIAGNSETGLYIKANGIGSSSVTNQQSGSYYGLITGDYEGVRIADLGTVANSGTIAGANGFGVELAAGGAVTNNHGAKIDGGVYGVVIDAGLLPGTVKNSGTIEQTGGTFITYRGSTARSGVQLKAGGTITNSQGGLITGVDGVGIAGGSGTVTNSGKIAGGSHDGVFLRKGGRVSNGQSGSTAGTITGGVDGVMIIGSSGTVTNFGSIAGFGAAGIYLKAGGIVTNNRSATVTGGYYGVLVVGKSGTIVNPGTITAFQTSGGAAILLRAGGNITNGANGSTAGVIKGAFQAISVSGGAGTILNRGTISATAGPLVGTGIFLGAGGLITNNAGASITALRTAVSLGGTTSAAAIVSNAGTITGSVGISVNPADSGKNTVVNSGRIAGGGGTAVQFGAGNDTLIVKPGAVFSGAVRGGGGTDTIIQSSAGTLKVTGFSGFETIRLANGGADGLTLTNANLTGVTGGLITVYGGNAGNTVNASALTGVNRVTVIGGAGADHFTGGAGNDTFKFSAASLTGTDTVAGGAGSDKLVMTTAGTIKAGGVTGVETVQLASGAANSLILTSANFTGVSGGTITVIDGNSGNIVTASALPSTDKLVIHAGTGADSLKGSAGNDVFYAGGKTTMTGGTGANRFTFADIGSNGITDFGMSATNELVFTNSGFSLGIGGATSTPQALRSSLIGSLTNGSFSNSTQRFAYNKTTGKLLFSAGGNGGVSHVVATLTGAPTLSASRFFFVS